LIEVELFCFLRGFLYKHVEMTNLQNNIKPRSIKKASTWAHVQYSISPCPFTYVEDRVVNEKGQGQWHRQQRRR